MLKIKLARFGKKNQPHYRIIVNEARSKRDGKYIALLGHYAPIQTPKILEIDLAAYKEWVSKGARPTATVAQLAARLESGKPFPAKKKKPSKKTLAKANAATEAPAAEKVPETTPEPEAKTPAETAATEVTEAAETVETAEGAKEEAAQKEK